MPRQEADPRPRVGETLAYDVYWMGLHIGRGTATVRSRTRYLGRDVYHVVAVARTNEVLSTLYPVRDVVQSFLDAETLLPVEFRKDLREGRYRARQRVRFDRSLGVAQQVSLTSGERKTAPIPPDAHDAVSAFYWCRRQALEKGGRYRATIHGNAKNWDLDLSVAGEEWRELLGGRVVPSIIVEPRTRYQGVLEKRGRVWIHLSADPRRIPIWIRFQTPFGPVTGALSKDTPLPE